MAPELQLFRLVKKSNIAFFVGAPSSIIMACSISTKHEHLRSVSILCESCLTRSKIISEYIDRTYELQCIMMRNTKNHEIMFTISARTWGCRLCKAINAFVILLNTKMLIAGLHCLMQFKNGLATLLFEGNF